MLKTHREVFTEYLRKADRWEGKLEDWHEWLDRNGLVRCVQTGLYGLYGTEVGHVDETDNIICYNDQTECMYRAEQGGCLISTSRDGFAKLFIVRVTLPNGFWLEFSKNTITNQSAWERALLWIIKRTGQAKA